MDPNQTLRRLRLLAELVTTSGEPDPDANDLAEAFNDLDTWLSKGGFLPNEWWQARQIAGRE